MVVSVAFSSNLIQPTLAFKQSGLKLNSSGGSSSRIVSGVDTKVQIALIL